ncbi:MAG: nicotinic acid mononucleotide adenylyltransferase, partial [Alphaproteobacteria bacterium]|nr:nicotinic acid mononucleotide adenylyltransferase [Alphaproteobacteria bacterium]
VSDIEAQFGTFYTIDIVKRLKLYYPNANFIWLMGADSLCYLHCWKDWDALMREVAIAIYPRAGHMARAGLAPAAVRFAEYRYAPQEASLLKFAKPPAWLLTGGVMNRLSSTLLRRAHSDSN